jgi:type IV secretory pathway VirB4 component
MAKKSKPASTQQHLPIAQIRDSIVVMKDGGFRTVLVVSAVNFALKSQQEQDALIYQFQNFLNSLTTPLQIVVQSRQLDLNSYLQNLSDQARNQPNELLRFQMVDYIDFVSRLITLANIMEKRFFVVVPHATVNLGSRGLTSMFLGGRKTTPHFTQEQFTRYQAELTERTNVIISGLSGMGLRAVQLTTQELVEFYYSIYNPEEAVEEKLVDVDDLRASIVSRSPGGPHA